jgi:hypothetical protein
MRAYIVYVPGIKPYPALARSTCEAIMDAQELHGVHTAQAWRAG